MAPSPPRQVPPPVQPHSVPRATHVDLLPKWQSNVRSRLRLLIFRLSISQSLSISISPGRCASVSRPLRPFFVNGNSPDHVPLFVLVCAAFVTPVCVFVVHSQTPALVFVRATRRSRYCLPLPFSPPSFQRLRPPPRPRSDQDHIRQAFLVAFACRTESQLTSTWSSRIHFARSLDKSTTLVPRSSCGPPTPDEIPPPNQTIGSDLVTARQPRQPFLMPHD